MGFPRKGDVSVELFDAADLCRGDGEMDVDHACDADFARGGLAFLRLATFSFRLISATTTELSPDMAAASNGKASLVIVT